MPVEAGLGDFLGNFISWPHHVVDCCFVRHPSRVFVALRCDRQSGFRLRMSRTQDHQPFQAQGTQPVWGVTLKVGEYPSDQLVGHILLRPLIARAKNFHSSWTLVLPFNWHVRPHSGCHASVGSRCFCRLVGIIPSDEQATQKPCWKHNWRVLVAIAFAIFALSGLVVGLVVTMEGGGGYSSSKSVPIPLLLLPVIPPFSPRYSQYPYPP